MCNKLHYDSIPIPESGEGWKIVIENKDKPGDLLSIVDHYRYKRFGDKISFEKTLFTDKCGFCFFLTLDEAKRASSAYDWTLRKENFEQKIVKIVYGGGLGTHSEPFFIADHEFQIALCKEFEVVNV